MYRIAWQKWCWQVIITSNDFWGCYDHGKIISSGTISWPIGFAGSFHKDLTGRQNAKFVARVYGVDTTKLLQFVEEFAELGAHFNLPVRTYSSGMKSRLAFGVSMAIHFDTYLIDEVTAVGDAAFKKKCHSILGKRLQKSGDCSLTLHEDH